MALYSASALLLITKSITIRIRDALVEVVLSTTPDKKATCLEMILRIYQINKGRTLINSKEQLTTRTISRITRILTLSITATTNRLRVTLDLNRIIKANLSSNMELLLCRDLGIKTIKEFLLHLVSPVVLITIWATKIIQFKEINLVYLSVEGSSNKMWILMPGLLLREEVTNGKLALIKDINLLVTLFFSNPSKTKINSTIDSSNNEVINTSFHI